MKILGSWESMWWMKCESWLHNVITWSVQYDTSTHANSTYRQLLTPLAATKCTANDTIMNIWWHPFALKSCFQESTRYVAMRPSVAWSFRPGHRTRYANELEQINWRIDNRRTQNSDYSAANLPLSATISISNLPPRPLLIYTGGSSRRSAFSQNYRYLYNFFEASGVR